MSYLISHAPHIREQRTVPDLMKAVMLALLPATIAGVIFFGLQALALIIVCTLTAVITEIVCLKLMKSTVPVNGGGAAITGLLLALCLPPSFPVIFAIIGSIFAIVIGKQLFGGLGYNIFNPALVGRAFLAAAFPVHMTTWVMPFAYRGVEAISSATPLAAMKFSQQSTSSLSLLFGNVGGCIGETSALLLLLGGIYLLWKKVINWQIPVSYLGTVAVFGGVFWLVNPAQFPSPIFQLLAGGLMLGAWFMLTDLVTSPITKKGLWIFGVGAGLLVVIIRLFSGLPEGVMYSILIMNAVVPLINRYTRPRILGQKK
ncbi:electron transporter RnfD [candidate division WOR-1 bacterium RIFOXYB2_FULL_42_35]|uniref:Ion-translocating oxidoreductase complex subunit D n=1 Tax=candidate division WOR-1 bacterium RIFOXYC2_FULL_41_25 TaxID=1802586 RepID=A0A1F4TPX1_UNCSA|nr:MAG: electron transporter RnfD [candidate division WOR-1 bacterium RIFOXYB2_FULL_42_35]OGC24535.1 MAG: electron transporter RnfD [candidate division WOR-1 bacterium RIFOXYA2_FULL_41_14]OGC34580.1 MAG: electron transporter RnfD [candidate division WOR-1 bacterium RIFOXYC2_FULL_41_25]OGC43733.1 MAG: electron transporter RnfD [candidate division WOR-1 bacterium RIFOXYD2_FULL_41_8]